MEVTNSTIYIGLEMALFYCYVKNPGLPEYL